MGRKVIKIFLFFAIIGLGILGFVLLTMGKSDPEKKPPTDNAVLVSVGKLENATETVTVSAMGTVVPSRAVTLFPEVSGRIVYQSENLVPGGRFKNGETILKIDPRDYDLSLQQQEASVRRAEMDLATERAKKEVAQVEWEQIKDEVQPTEDGKRLALREIQLETAEAALESAKSGLNKAKLSRSRTIVKAPYNGMITEEFVDLGQLVGPSSKIAVLVDSDVFWVRTSVPVDKLHWIEVPKNEKDEGGSKAKVIYEIGGNQKITRNGRVKRLMGDLDAKGKMAQLLVEVDNPLDPDDVNERSSSFPLFLGAYVNVEIAGPVMGDVFRMPRRALRDGDTVWLQRDNKLRILKIEVVWTTGNEVFFRGDVNVGDEMVTSQIAAPVDGMPLTTETSEDVASSASDEEGK